MNIGILTVATGISGLFGLLGLVVYLFYQQQVTRVERSIKGVVEGEGLLKSGQVVDILKQFKTDASRLEALMALTNHDETKAKNILSKVKENIDVEDFTKITSNNTRKISLTTGIIFLCLALIGLLFSIFSGNNIIINGKTIINGDCNNVGLIITAPATLNCNSISDTQKVNNFDSLYQQTIGNQKAQYYSSHNGTKELEVAMKRELGSNVNPDYWVKFGDIWNKHAIFLNGFYNNLAICFSRSACALSPRGTKMCNELELQLERLTYVATNIENTGAPLTINYTGTQPVIPINVIDIPSISNLKVLYKVGCGKEIS